MVKPKRNMKKLVLTILILTFVLLTSPNQSYAAWWNPLSWFASKEQVKEQKADEQKSKEEIAITPPPQTQTNNSDTSENLRAEVATLKVNLDSLYKAHNELLKYTTEIVAVIRSEIKNTPQAPVGNNLETRVMSLEEKLENACAKIFSAKLIGAGATRCPSSRFPIKESLESRIKKLEGGY